MSEGVYYPGDIVYLDTDDKGRIIARLENGSYDVFVFSLGEKRNRSYKQLSKELIFDE